MEFWTYSKALFAEILAGYGVRWSCAVGDRGNFLTGLLSTVNTQGRSHLCHNFAMISSIKYAILSLH